MKSMILAVMLAAACSTGAALADDAPFGASPSAPSTPGAPAPTPYPQLTVPPPPGDGGIKRDSPLLPAIKTPSPPKEQGQPGFDSTENKARAPNG